MDTINPWIDLNETRRMAERLMLPSRAPVEAPDDTGFDDSFVGFSEPLNSAVPIDVPASVEVEESRGVQADHDGLPEVDLSSIFVQQRAMLREEMGSIASFMVDAGGTSLFNDGNYGAYHFIAQELTRTEKKVRHVRLKAGAKAILEIIAIESESGFSYLGIVLPRNLSEEEVGQIRLQWLGVE